MNKKVAITLSSIAGVLAITAGSLAVFLPVSYNYDKSLIKRNPDYSVALMENDKYITIAKVDEKGHPTNDDFKILSFTDVHLDTYKKKSTAALEMVIRNVVNEKPDLVVFDGDIITSSINRRRAKQFVNVMNKLGVYWAAVLGNHEGDNMWSITRKQLMSIYATSPYCLIDTSKKEGVDGLGNTVINILNGDNKISQSLYLIDSGAYMSDEDLEKYKDEIENPENNRYDYIKESQIEWYKENVDAIERENGTRVKSIMYAHIPLPEYDDAVENGTILSGEKRETICHSGHNSGMFDTILEKDSTQAVVSGHDHINDFVAEYQGVRLGYCQSSGYSSYNVVTRGLSDALIQGYSRLMLNNQGDLTWENIKNADVWPSLQPDILKMYK